MTVCFLQAGLFRYLCLGTHLAPELDLHPGTCAGVNQDTYISSLLTCTPCILDLMVNLVQHLILSTAGNVHLFLIKLEELKHMCKKGDQALCVGSSHMCAGGQSRAHWQISRQTFIKCSISFIHLSRGVF